MLKASIVVVLILYVGFAAAAYLLADRMIFLPPPSSYTDRQLPIVWVPADDGVRIATLYLPNPGAEHTIVYSHGNAEDLGHLAPLLRELRGAGFSVLAYDYRGYGLSTGDRPTADGAYRDLHAVYRHAVDELGIRPEQIILLGRSVGAGPATALAAREPVGGLVVESAFTSAFRVLTRVRLLPFDRFDNLQQIRRVRCPVLVIHGTEDDIIPPAHGRRLYEAAPEPRVLHWVTGAGHNDLVSVAAAEYWQVLRSFAARLERPEPAP